MPARSPAAAAAALLLLLAVVLPVPRCCSAAGAAEPGKTGKPAPPPESGGLVVVPGEEACDGGAASGGPEESRAQAAQAAPTPGINDAIKLGPEHPASDPVNSEPFVATDEWQEVKPGQAVPAGLHVTIDMQTGEKRAKLLDEKVGIDVAAARAQAASENELKQAITLAKEAQAGKATRAAGATEAEGGKGPHINEAMEAGIRKIDDGGNVTETSPEKLAKFRKSLADAQARGLRMREDAEVMMQITAALQATAAGSADAGDLVVLLEELEGFVHHVDNAVDFCTMGGMQLVVGLLDNATVAENARSLAAVIVGSAASNNPSVQASAQQLGAVAALVRQLEHSTGATERKRALFAVKALVRHRPGAFDEFAALGGVRLAVDAQQPGAKANSNAVRGKAVSLVADMLGEQAAAAYERAAGKPYAPPPGGLDVELWTRHAGKTPLAEMLVGHASWCEGCVHLLRDTGPDAQEPALLCMLATMAPCARAFGESNATAVLGAIEADWKASNDEDPDPWFDNLLATVRAVQVSAGEHSEAQQQP